MRHVNEMNRRKQMNQKILSENLSIHYICFNIQGFIKLEDIQKIAFYLFELFGFNSTFISYDRTQGWQEKKFI